MPIHWSDIDALIAEHADPTESRLVVGELEGPAGDAVSYERFFTATAHDVRCSLGVCVNPSEAETPILARLRDVHCDRILLILEDHLAFKKTDLLALGFQRLGEVNHLYLYMYSPEVTDRPRDWNNADRWANPENFDKYRW